MNGIKNEFSLLYRIAAASAFAMITLIPIQILVFVISPPPISVAGYFDLFTRSPLLGLLSLDLLYIINSILIIPMYLAFYFSLKDLNKSALILAMTFGFVGLAAYFPSNVSFEMLNLSMKFAAASGDLPRQALLAAGESLLAIYVGSTFNVYYVLNALTLITISLVMFRSAVYGRVAAWIGLIAGLLMVIPSTAGQIGMIFSLLSLLPWIVFTLLAAGRFRRLSQPSKI